MTLNGREYIKIGGEKNIYKLYAVLEGKQCKKPRGTERVVKMMLMKICYKMNRVFAKG